MRLAYISRSFLACCSQAFEHTSRFDLPQHDQNDVTHDTEIANGGSGNQWSAIDKVEAKALTLPAISVLTRTRQ